MMPTTYLVPEAPVPDAPRLSEQRRADAMARLASWYPGADPFDLARLVAETHDALYPSDAESWPVGQWSYVDRYAAATALLDVPIGEVEQHLTPEQTVRLRLTDDRRDL